VRRALVVLALAGCAQHQASPTAGVVNSLELEMIDPALDALGSPTAPVAAQSATFNVIARDERGQQFTGDVDVNVFISFGGVKTGGQGKCGSDDSGTKPLTTLHLTAGQLMSAKIALPSAFGATSLWLDEPQSHATGASPTIYFRNPFISDVQTPPDLSAANATFCSPFNGKYIIVDHAQASGELVVSSVFSDAFVITDTGASAFNNIYLYAFGKPPSYIVPGKVVSSFSGNVSKFIGFTELNFPLFDAPDANPVDPTLLPAPLVLSFADHSSISKLLGVDAGVVTYTGTLCNPDPPNPSHDSNIQKTIDSWIKFNQFVVDGDGTCGAFTNYAVELPAKTLGAFDPLVNVGKTVTITGMLRNNSGQNPELDNNNQTIACDPTENPCALGSCINGICMKGAFNFWTIQPRTPADVTVQ
jgi:hypothetical protein